MKTHKLEAIKTVILDRTVQWHAHRLATRVSSNAPLHVPIKCNLRTSQRNTFLPFQTTPINVACLRVSNIMQFTKYLMELHSQILRLTRFLLENMFTDVYSCSFKTCFHK